MFKELEEFPQEYKEGSKLDPIKPLDWEKIKAAEAMKMVKLCKKVKNALLGFFAPTNLLSTTLWPDVDGADDSEAVDVTKRYPSFLAEKQYVDLLVISDLQEDHSTFTTLNKAMSMLKLENKFANLNTVQR